MLARLRSSLSYANVMATIALFIALLLPRVAHSGCQDMQTLQ